MSGGALGSLRAVVTGGSSGIGAAVVMRLRAAGARVAVLDRVVPARADGVFSVAADVADDASVRAAVEAVAAEFGGIDVLVNNAGIGAQGTVADNDDDEWHRVLDVNVVGTARVSRAALPHLVRSEHASVVNICSVAASVGLPSRALYSATKGAIEALTRAMAADHLAQGVRVNCVSPGTADTPWVARLLESAADPGAERRALEARQPHGRLVTPAEIAAAVAYLVAPESASTTGTVLAVDGGMASLRVRQA